MYDKILKELERLAKIDESLAKDYFYDVLTNEETHESLSQEDVVNLFETVMFEEDNTNFKMSVLNDATLHDILMSSTKYEIFVGLINSKDRYELLYGDDFAELSYVYSEIRDFIDDNYVKTLLAHHDYIHPSAIFNVLTSPHMTYVKNSLIDQLVKTYEFDERTMYTEALTILRNPPFVRMSTNHQIEELVNRISLNLPSKESKKFIMEVMKIPEVRKKYMDSGKLYDFKYMEGLKEESVFPLLVQKGYYDKILKVSDLDGAIDLINFYKERDESFFDYLNFHSINDTTMKLDKDLLFGLIKSEHQNLLISVSRSIYKDAFVKCANYLNERYPNVNVAKLIDVLEHNRLPDFVSGDLKNVDIPMLTHYLLNNSDMKMASLRHYEYAIMENLANVMTDNHANISAVKDALCMNRYGFTYDKVCALYRSYAPFVESSKDENLIREFKEFKDIIFNYDKNVLYKKYMTNIFSFDKSNKYEEDIKRLYTKELKESILSSKDLVVNDDMYFEGEIVPVVRVKGEFRGLISAVGFVKKLDVINDNYKDSLRKDMDYNLHGLSTTLYTDDNPSRVTGRFILGYSDFDLDTVQATAPLDIFSESNKYELEAEFNSVYVPPRETGRYTREDYNEILIERRVRNKNSPNYLDNIYPSYVFIDTDNERDMRNAIKASRDLGIPLVYFDRAECIRENKRKYVELSKKYKGNSAKEFIEFANVIFGVRNNTRSDEYGVIKKLTSDLIKNAKNKDDLVKAEEFLSREISKGGHNDYLDVYQSIAMLRREIAKNAKPLDVVREGKIDRNIQDRINNMVRMGAISTRDDNRGAKDVYALTSASMYLFYNSSHLTKSLTASKLLDASLQAGAIISEFEQGYIKSNNNPENGVMTDLFIDYHRYAMKTFYNIDVSTSDLCNFKLINVKYATNDNNEIRKYINLARNLVMGEDLEQIAEHLELDLGELLKFRERLISIYNNETKKVASNKK